MKTSYYLVPVDFSSVTLNALISACEFFKNENPVIIAMHVVSKKSERAAAHTKMDEMLAQVPAEFRDYIEPRVIVGDLFSDIARAVDFYGARTVVMGTHGARGMQKIFGSNALKLVGSTSCPFIILQDQVKLEKLEHIVMPYNFEKESIQIVSYAAFLAKKYDSTIHIVGSHEDDEWLKGKSFTNQSIIRNLLDEHQIKYRIENLPKSNDFDKDIMAYAQGIQADMIAAAFFGDNLFQSMNPFIQTFIENDLHIPFLTVSTEEMGISTGSIANPLSRT